MSVKDSKLLLPDGMSYRVLVLAGGRNHDAAIAGEKSKTVKDGATVDWSKANQIAQPVWISKLAMPEVQRNGKNELLGRFATAKQSRSISLEKGKIILGQNSAGGLAGMSVPMDFQAQDDYVQPIAFGSFTRLSATRTVYFGWRIAFPQTEDAICAFRRARQSPATNGMLDTDRSRIRPIYD